MKNSMEFVSKLLRRGMDDDFNNLHLCYKLGHIQTNDGVVTLSYPSPLVSGNEECITIKGLTGVNAINICADQSSEINITDKNYIIKAPVINFRAMFPYHRDYTPRVVTKKQIKKATPLPKEFIKFVRSMTSFTVKDSDHMFASSINLINNRMYATNNIVVVRTAKTIKIKMKDCIVPRPLINALLKIKADPTGVIVADEFIAFTYAGGAFAMCPLSTESAPDLGAIFDRFKKPIPLDTPDKQSLERSILMDSGGEIKCETGVVTTNNSEIKDTNLSDFKVDTANLEMLLKLFNNVRFTREYTFMSNDTFEVILAGRA